MKKIAILTGAALVVGLLATPVLASNTGFKLNYAMRAGGTNLVSLPYFYFPDGDVANPTQTAQAACDDLSTTGGGDCTINALVEFRRDAQNRLTPFTKSCASQFVNFDLQAGVAYLVNAAADCTANIVGSHDDNYSFGKGSTTLSLLTGNNPVSVPYHVQANNAQELCDDIETNFAPGIAAIVRLTASGPFTKSCASQFVNFDLEPGEGFFFNAPQDLDIQMTTY